MGKMDATRETTSLSSLKRRPQESRKVMKRVLLKRETNSARRREQLAAMPAREAWFAPRRLPMRTEEARESEKGAWNVVDAETSKTDWAASVIAPS